MSHKNDFNDENLKANPKFRTFSHKTRKMTRGQSRKLKTDMSQDECIYEKGARSGAKTLPHIIAHLSLEDCENRLEVGSYECEGDKTFYDQIKRYVSNNHLDSIEKEISDSQDSKKKVESVLEKERRNTEDIMKRILSQPVPNSQKLEFQVTKQLREIFERISNIVTAEWAYGEKYGRANAHLEFATNINKIGKYALHCRNEADKLKDQQKYNQGGSLVPVNVSVETYEEKTDFFDDKIENKFIPKCAMTVFRKIINTFRNHQQLCYFITSVLFIMGSLLFLNGAIVAGTKTDMQLIPVYMIQDLIPDSVLKFLDDYMPRCKYLNRLLQHPVTYENYHLGIE